MTQDAQIAVLLEDGGSCIACRGEVDLAVAADLRRAVDAALGLGPTCWVDLRAVTFLDSSAVHVLLYAQRRARARGVCLLIAPAEQAGAMRPFELTGLMDVLPFAERLVDAPATRRTGRFARTPAEASRPVLTLIRARNERTSHMTIRGHSPGTTRPLS